MQYDRFSSSESRSLFAGRQGSNDEKGIPSYSSSHFPPPSIRRSHSPSSMESSRTTLPFMHEGERDKRMVPTTWLLNEHHRNNVGTDPLRSTSSSSSRQSFPPSNKWESIEDDKRHHLYSSSSSSSLPSRSHYTPFPTQPSPHRDVHSDYHSSSIPPSSSSSSHYSDYHRPDFHSTESSRYDSSGYMDFRPESLRRPLPSDSYESRPFPDPLEARREYRIPPSTETFLSSYMHRADQQRSDMIRDSFHGRDTLRADALRVEPRFDALRLDSRRDPIRMDSRDNRMDTRMDTRMESRGDSRMDITRLDSTRHEVPLPRHETPVPRPEKSSFEHITNRESSTSRYDPIRHDTRADPAPFRDHYREDPLSRRHDPFPYALRPDGSSVSGSPFTSTLFSTPRSDAFRDITHSDPDTHRDRDTHRAGVAPRSVRANTPDAERMLEVYKSDMFHLNATRRDVPKKSPSASPTPIVSPSPPSPYKRSFDPFASSHDVNLPTPHRNTKFRLNADPAAAAAKAGPPSPVFTMETPGGSHDPAPHPKNPVKFSFKDFKENEYNLHSSMHGHPTTAPAVGLLSAKQQKRHKRIINKALQQGQARSRTQSDDKKHIKEELSDDYSSSQDNNTSPDQDEEYKTEAEKRRKRPIEDSTKDDIKPKRMTTRSQSIEIEEIPIQQKRKRTVPKKILEQEPPQSPSDEEEMKEESKRSVLQNSGEAVIEQFGSYEELQRTMSATRSSNRLRTKALSGRNLSGKIHCYCKRPETDAMVQCDSCDEWFHFECVELNEAMAQEIVQYFCSECRGRGSLTKKMRIEELISESDEPAPRAVPKTPPSPASPVPSVPLARPSPKIEHDKSEEDSAEEAAECEDVPIMVGDSVVSISCLAKQPWLDGWVTARALAVRYLQEAKILGFEINESRRLPKQVAVRTSTKGKRAWRQAEVLLAIQFLKTADLVETSTKKGTLVREPCKTIDDLISRAMTVTMPNRNNIGKVKVKVVEFTRTKVPTPSTFSALPTDYSRPYHLDEPAPSTTNTNSTTASTTSPPKSESPSTPTTEPSSPTPAPQASPPSPTLSADRV